AGITAGAVSRRDPASRNGLRDDAERAVAARCQGARVIEDNIAACTRAPGGHAFRAIPSSRQLAVCGIARNAAAPADGLQDNAMRPRARGGNPAELARARLAAVVPDSDVDGIAAQVLARRVAGNCDLADIGCRAGGDDAATATDALRDQAERMFTRGLH